MGTVYVLSLPAFQWTTRPQTSSTGFARWHHTCNVIGKRQMVSVGGMTANASQDTYQKTQRSKDPWEQGLGVFDLTELVWKEGYDANDEPYRSPDIVRAYHSANGPVPVAGWSNDVVRGLFANTSPTRLNGTDAATPTQQNKATLVGGTVGGIAGLAIVVIAIVFLIKHTGSRKDATIQYESQYPELTAAENERLEVDGALPAREMAQRENATTELQSDGRLKSELPGQIMATVELPSP